MALVSLVSIDSIKTVEDPHVDAKGSWFTLNHNLISTDPCIKYDFEFALALMTSHACS